MEDQNDIWQDDLLDRKSEADEIIGLIETVSKRPNVREDARAFTMSIDAGYGEGKTYFLKRLARQLKIKHPVAYVDAWQDDLADEPLTALVATLQDALGDRIADDPKVKEQWLNFKTKSWAVTKVVLKGLAKKSASVAITTGGVEAVEAIFSGQSDEEKEKTQEEAKDASDNFVDEAARVLKSPEKLMQSRIDDFKAGQNAINDLKSSLIDLVSALEGTEIWPPVVIIIDELDRCRPTYAVKLLEEIKHLFDVAGMVFIFGINTDQLAHSVVGAYGPNFDGKAYLSRFINQRYKLKSPHISNLVSFLIKEYKIDRTKFYFPEAMIDNINQNIDSIISYCLKIYKFSVRDTINIFEKINLCFYYIDTGKIFMPAFLPLMLAKYKEQNALKQVDLSSDRLLHFKFYNLDEPKTLDWYQVLNEFQNYLKLNDSELKKDRRRREYSNVFDIFYIFVLQSKQDISPFTDPREYLGLLDTIGQFSKIDE